MIARPIARAPLLPLLGLLVAACSTTVAQTPAAVPTPGPTAAATMPAPTPSPEPSVDPNALPPTTTTGWWGDPDGATECVMVGHYRIGYRVAQIGDCLGVRVEAPPELTLDVGEDFDLHMTIPADGAPPIYPMPDAEDPLIVRGWLAFDDATWTYRALSPGTTRLLSAAPCKRGSREMVPPTNPCPVLVIHVRDISTRCVDLAEDVCRVVAAQAVLRGWGQDPGQRIVGWVVQPDHFFGGSDCGEGVAKVTFTYADPDSEVTIQIGQVQPAASGPPRYVVCTY